MTLEPLTTLLCARHRAVLRDVEGHQRSLLRSILERSAGSPVAKALGLSGRESAEEFLALPPRDSDFYRTYTELAFTDRHAFGSEPIVALGETSGSTGEPKLIPHTARSLGTVQQFSRRALLFQLREGRHFIPHFTKWLLVTASTTVRVERGMKIGFISGLMYELAQRQRRDFILPTPPVASIVDWQERIERTVHEAWRKPVGSLIGVPAYLERFLDIAESVARGEPLSSVWPSLGRVYYSGTPITSQERLEQLIGRPIVTRGLYTATEGSFAAELEMDCPQPPSCHSRLITISCFATRHRPGAISGCSKATPASTRSGHHRRSTMPSRRSIHRTPRYGWAARSSMPPGCSCSRAEPSTRTSRRALPGVASSSSATCMRTFTPCLACEGSRRSHNSCSRSARRDRLSVTHS